MTHVEIVFRFPKCIFMYFSEDELWFCSDDYTESNMADMLIGSDISHMS